MPVQLFKAIQRQRNEIRTSHRHRKISKVTQKKMNAVISAIENNRPDVLDLFLRTGVSVNQQDTYGNTPLHYVYILNTYVSLHIGPACARPPAPPYLCAPSRCRRRSSTSRSSTASSIRTSMTSAKAETRAPALSGLGTEYRALCEYVSCLRFGQQG